MADDDVTSLVIDNGSGTIKAGFAVLEEPSFIFPSLVGRKRRQDDEEEESEDFFVGNEAQNQREICDLKHPIERGLICDWDGMEKLWHHAFHNELGVEPENCNVLLTEVVHNWPAYREKMAEYMFEKFNVRCVHVAVQSALAMLAYGQSTGLAVDSGEGVTCVVPVHDGEIVRDAAMHMDVAGADITKYLAHILGEFETDAAQIERIKEELCYVALDFDRETKVNWQSSDSTYELPDGRRIKLGNETFRAPEALFKPPLVGLDRRGLQHVVRDVVEKCPEEMRKELYGRVHLCGGTTACAGLAPRLHLELNALAPADVRVRVHEAANRKYAAWIGGSTLVSTLGDGEGWATREQYEERGAGVVNPITNKD